MERMRQISITVIGLLLAATPALAADPTGEWLVANGHAKIKIENCGKSLWGVISWESEPGGHDTNNPDPSKRERPTLGMPILLDMKPSEPNKWDGHVYNAENGKTYDANISLSSPDVLRIEGCVLGFLCGGEDWTRVSAPADAQNPASGRTAGSPPRGSRPATPPQARRRAPPAGAAPAPSAVCSNVATSTGLAHERRLK
jgi:uncharacterized protein (DUF2147 family)